MQAKRGITVSISSNTSWYVYNFRLGLIRSLLKKGVRVAVVAPRDKYLHRLAEEGCDTYDVYMDNKGVSPFRDLRTLFAYYRRYRAIKPDVALHNTVKPNVYGTIAARLCGIPVINTITGLGTVFVKKGWKQQVVKMLYKATQRLAARVYFQNRDDRALFIKSRLIPPGLASTVPGSGVDTNRFQPRIKRTQQPFVFLLLGRILGDKGVGEYVQAARRLKASFPDTRFWLLGLMDAENRTAVPRREVEAWAEEGVVEYQGESDEVERFIAECDCVVLPSYREGLPRSLLEAASMGKPIIATDVAGCRDVVDDGKNGFLCRPRDVSDLADKMEKMLSLAPDRRAEMGGFGREKVLREYDQDIVIDQYLQAIQGVVGGADGLPAETEPA